MDKNILQLKDGLERVVNRGEFDRYINEISYSSINEGIRNISKIHYTLDEPSGFIHINTFSTGIEEDKTLNKIHDIRSGPRPFEVKKPNRRRGGIGMNFM